MLLLWPQKTGSGFLLLQRGSQLQAQQSFPPVLGWVGAQERGDVVDFECTATVLPVTGTLSVVERHDSIAIQVSAKVSAVIAISDRRDTVSLSGLVAANAVSGTLNVQEQRDGVAVSGLASVSQSGADYETKKPKRKKIILDGVALYVTDRELKPLLETALKRLPPDEVEETAAEVSPPKVKPHEPASVSFDEIMRQLKAQKHNRAMIILKEIQDEMDEEDVELLLMAG